MKHEIATGVINGFNMALSTPVSLVMFMSFYKAIIRSANMWFTLVKSYKTQYYKVKGTFFLKRDYFRIGELVV